MYWDKFDIVLFSLLICFNAVTAQNNSLNDRMFPKNLVLCEIGGNGQILSLNYQRYITKKFAARVGIGTVLPFVYGVSFPAMFNYYLGNESDNLEIGLGFTHSFFTSYKNEEKTLIGTTIGWWHKMSTGSGVIRVSFTPFYDLKKNKFLPWGGLSFGFSF
jgi:hypothetical protein